MKKILLPFLLSTAAFASPLTIEVGATAGRPYVEYRFPAGQLSANFAETEPGYLEVRATRWRAADDCAELAEGGIRRRDEERCRRVRFEIAPGTLGMDRVYQIAQPLGRGVITHTAHFALAQPGVRWVLRPAPGDTVIHEGRTARTTVAIAGRGEADSAEAPRYANSMLYFGKNEAVRRWGKAYVVVAPDFPPELEAMLKRLYQGASRDYRRALGAHDRPLAMLLHFRRDEDMAFSFHGDTSRGAMVRLAFEGSHRLDAQGRAMVRSFLAHEMAHLWNSGLYKNVGKTPWLHEGGAEWIAHSWLRQSGALDEAQYRDVLERAIDGCRAKLGNAAFGADGNASRGFALYQCGMAFHLLAYFDQQARGSRLSPLQSVAAFYRANPAYDLDKWLDHFAAAPDLRDLITGKTPVAAGLAAAVTARQAGWRNRGQSAGGRLDVAKTIVRAVQAADCEGQVSYETRPDHFLLSPLPQCRKLNRPLKVTKVAGVALRAEPQGAVLALRAACREGGEVPVGTDEGETVALACPASLDFDSDYLELKPVQWPQLSAPELAEVGKGARH